MGLYFLFRQEGGGQVKSLKKICRPRAILTIADPPWFGSQQAIPCQRNDPMHYAKKLEGLQYIRVFRHLHFRIFVTIPAIAHNFKLKLRKAASCMMRLGQPVQVAKEA